MVETSARRVYGALKEDDPVTWDTRALGGTQEAENWGITSSYATHREASSGPSRA